MCACARERVCVCARERVCAHACTCLGGGECFGQGELPLSRPGGDTECGAGGGTRTRYRAECERELVRIAGKTQTTFSVKIRLNYVLRAADNPTLTPPLLFPSSVVGDEILLAKDCPLSLLQINPS